MTTLAADQPAAEPPVLSPGTELGAGYRVLAHVSRGEALDVYEVYSDLRMCSCMAKVVRPDRRHIERVVSRLRQEGEILLRGAHPHLVRCWEVVEEPQLAVVLETITGPTLEQVVEERERRLPAEEIAHLGRHLCSVLHYLHAQDVLHLDIRPANVMSQVGVTKLIDLSLAGTPGPARRGRGTRDYMAPEQARGGFVSAATDVWGVGATLYEAATGEPPFAPMDDAEQAVRDAHGYLQLHRGALPIRSFGRRLPGPLARLIEGCLRPDPAARPTVEALYAGLGEVLDALDARASAGSRAVAVTVG